MGNPGANILVPIAFFSWPLIVIFFFKKFDKRLVPVIAYVAGWMFLPCAEYDVFLLKNTKTTVIGLGILAGAYLFDRDRLSKFQFNTIDIPVLLLCTSPFFSSLFNDLGVYDGLSQVMYQTIRWGLPYYIGRIYFSDTEILKTLGISIVIGGIIYVPFCLFELIMSPLLHNMTYGFFQHSLLQTMRENGGYRPMVYMEHGLMTSMWMILASLVGTWLLYCGELPKKILFVPSHLLVFLLVGTSILMQSVGAISFYVITLAVLYLSKKMKKIVLVTILLLCPHLYIIARIGTSWNGTNFSNFIAKTVSSARAASIQFRFDNETILMNRAKEGTLFGWGGYGRSRVHTESGKSRSVTDGLWIIVYGANGIYGLSVMILAIQLPTILFIRRIKPEQWQTMEFAAPAVMAVFLAITMIDNLLNAMINPIYMIFCGGLNGMLLTNPQLLSSLSLNSKNELPFALATPGTRFISGTCIPSSKFLG